MGCAGYQGKESWISGQRKPDFRPVGYPTNLKSATECRASGFSFTLKAFEKKNHVYISTYYSHEPF